MSGDEADVIVIGGGVAGLSAVDVLSVAGKKVILLEGRERLGGRIDTRHDPAWPTPIERGAEFIHGLPEETWGIVHAGLCCAYDVAGDFRVFEKGKLRQAEFFEEIDKVLGVVKKVTREDMTFDACLEKYGKRFGGEIKKWARNFVAGFDAADPAVVSAKWLAAAQRASDAIEGERAFRIAGGYDGVVKFLESGIQEGGSTTVELSTVVHKVSWSKKGVTVEGTKNGEAATWRGRRVAVTVPVGVLQLEAGEEGAIVFEPALPGWKREAIGQLRMGTVTKVVMRFKEAFWEEKNPELCFFTAPGHAIPTWWTTLPLRTTVLTGWAGGPPGAGLSGKGSGEILEIAMAELAKILGVSVRRVRQLFAGGHVCDWKSEPLSRGAYSYAAAGGVNAAKKLAKPVEGVLYFAGEAAYEGMSGTVAGAIASGRRAGREILR